MFQKMKNCNFPRVVFIVSIIFLIFFSSFLLPVVQKNPKNGKLQFSSNFFHLFFHLFFFIFHHFCFQWCKNLKKWKIAIFLEFFSFFFIFFIFLSLFFHFVIICFSFFYYFFIIFHHFCFQWCKNSAKNEKLQFSSSFLIFFIIF